MGNYEQLKQSVSDVIKTNGNKEITGSILQNVLLTIISSVGANAAFVGIATPTTNPGTPDGPVFYLASESGTYTNFNAIELQAGLSVLMWNGSWNSQQVFGVDDIPTAESDNLVKSGGVAEELALGAVYDVSAKNPTAGVNNDGKWESLSALLSDANLNTLIPTAVRKGGMSIKFIHTSDNKYVQARLKTQDFSLSISDWDREEISENILNKAIDFSSYIIEGGYIDLSGNIESLAGYFYTSPIQVKKGDIFIAPSTNGDTNVSLLYEVLSNGKQIQRLFIAHAESDIIYSYTFDRDTYVLISGRNGRRHKIQIIRQGSSFNTVDTAIKDNTSLLGDIIRFNDSNIIIGYYATDQTLVPLSYFFYSSPVRVSVGDKFIAKSLTNVGNLSLLREVTSTGDFVKTLIGGSNIRGDYEYIFTKECYISVSYEIPQIYKISILRNGDIISTINKTLQPIENYKETFSTNDVIVGYYRSSYGDIETFPNSYFYSLPILVHAGEKFIATNVGADSNVSLLAEVDSDNNFIQRLLRAESAGSYQYSFTRTMYVSFSGNVNILTNLSIIRYGEAFQQIENEIQEVRENTVTYNVTDRLTKLSENPVASIRYDCGLFAIFKNVGVVGDSLASGEMQGYNAQGGEIYRDMYEFSWGQQLAKMTGVDVFNFSSGGQTAKGWMNGTGERTWAGAQNNPKQAYIIGLGINDKTLVVNGSYTDGIGDVTTDIDISNPSNNADSFVGQYARIIQSLKSIESRSYIFCITPPRSDYTEYAQKIRQIVEIFSSNRVYLIDLATYGMSRNASWMWMGNHLSAAGYLYSAYEIANYVDWLIRNNGEDFRYTAVVGTDILDRNPIS